MVTIHTRISQNPNKENTTKPTNKLVALVPNQPYKKGQKKLFYCLSGVPKSLAFLGTQKPQNKNWERNGMWIFAHFGNIEWDIGWFLKIRGEIVN